MGGSRLTCVEGLKRIVTFQPRTTGRVTGRCVVRGVYSERRCYSLCDGVRGECSGAEDGRSRSLERC